MMSIVERDHALMSEVARRRAYCFNCSNKEGQCGSCRKSALAFIEGLTANARMRYYTQVCVSMAAGKRAAV